MAKRKINSCLVPTPIDPKEVDLWQKLHTLHCDRKRESHRCRGSITVTATAVTLNCPVCGDSRRLLNGEAQTD